MAFPGGGKYSPTPTFDTRVRLGFVLTVDWLESTFMPLGLDKVREDRFFAQCLARLKPMQTLHEDEALAVAPDYGLGSSVRPQAYFAQSRARCRA